MLSAGTARRRTATPSQCGSAPPTHACSSSRASPDKGGGGPRGGKMVQRVAIAGFGAIGRVVAEALDRGIDGLALAAVSARDMARAERAMAGLARKVPVVPLARLVDA